MTLDPHIFHVRHKPCETCIFSNRSPISAAEREKRVARLERSGGYQECHHYTIRHPRRGRKVGVCCYNFWLHHHTLAVVLARALGVVRFVDDDGQPYPPQEETP